MARLRWWLNFVELLANWYKNKKYVFVYCFFFLMRLSTTVYTHTRIHIHTHTHTHTKQNKTKFEHAISPRHQGFIQHLIGVCGRIEGGANELAAGALIAALIRNIPATLIHKKLFLFALEVNFPRQSYIFHNTQFLIFFLFVFFFAQFRNKIMFGDATHIPCMHIHASHIKHKHKHKQKHSIYVCMSVSAISCSTSAT